MYSGDDGIVSDIRSYVTWIGAGLAVAILLVGALVPLVSGVPFETSFTLAVFFGTVLTWLTKPVPYLVSSLISVHLLFAAGVFESYPDAMSGYSSTLFFFLLLLFLLGQAINDVDLDALLVHRLFSVDGEPGDAIRVLGWTQLLVSLVVPSSVARTVTFIPIIERLGERYGAAASEFKRSAGFVVGHINPIASIAIMTGGALPIITSELIRINVGYISWLRWSVYLVPPALLLYGTSTFVASWLYSRALPPATSGTGAGTSTGAGAGAGAGVGASTHAGVDASTGTGTDADTGVGDTHSVDTPGESRELTRDQKVVVGTMAVTILLWLIGSFYQISNILPAVLAVAILSAPGVNIIDGETITEVSWGILFLIGTMLSILDAMTQSGTIQLIIEAISDAVPFAAANEWQLVVLLLAVSLGLRLFFSAAPAAVIVILPIILQFGSEFGVNQLYLAFSVMILMITPTVLPFNTITVLISFDEGFISGRDVFVFGLYSSVLSAITILFGWAVYWPLVS